ncbi:MAG TPA: phosphoribosyltransferase family protein [Stellaceae bacterium]|nr:phosphoribosyltransferase family protein [Stellaceae bacterium]
MVFRDRREAGRLLAERLAGFREASPVVLGLPRGGVPVAFEIAQGLRAPLDVLLVRKVGVPWQPELALGAVSDGADPEIFIDQQLKAHFDIDDHYVAEACEREIAEIDRRRAAFRGNLEPLPVEGRVAIVVDDGIATGATTRVALRALRRRKPSRTILAVPVAPRDSLDALRGEADEIVCLETPENMGAVGFYYQDFRQTTDREVQELLARSRQDRVRRT